MLSTTVVKTVKPFDTVQMKLQTRNGGNSTQILFDKPAGGRGPTLHIKKIDPLRALEPTRKKLTTIEAQRIMAVLVETIRRTEIVGILPYIIDNVDRFNVMLGTELVQMLQDHSVLMSSFRELKADTERLIELDNERRREKALHEFELHENNDDDDVPRERTERTERDDDAGDEDDGQVDDEDDGGAAAGLMDDERPMSVNSISDQTEAAMRQMMLVARQMQNSCKNILRAFSTNPSAVTTILKEVINPEVMRNMVGDMNELRLIIMGRLLTTPVEETERNDYLKVIMQRERFNAALIAKLEAELDAAITDKNEEIRKKNDVIRKLQSDLHHIEKYSDEFIRRTRTDADKQEAADVKNSEGKRQKLQVEAQQLKGSLTSLTEEHRTSEGQLRKKKFKVETECENWIQKYDNDMGQRQDEYEMIDSVYTEEKKQLNELEERFKTLEEEYNQIQEEQRIAREKREAAEKKLRTSMKAATTIQAFWRSFKVRKALKGKKKGKGKGKKGKK